MVLEAADWWAGRVRQFRSHIAARVTEPERLGLAAWATPGELRIFDAMHVADRRHGLDVVASLRAEGVSDREVLAAALIHDAGKGDVGLWPRVVHALGQRHGPWAGRLARLVPGFGRSLDQLAGHAAASAAMAAEVGCSTRTVELIRWQEAPRDEEFGELLRLADEAN